MAEGHESAGVKPSQGASVETILQEAEGIARLVRLAPPGMVAIRADLANQALAERLSAVLGQPLPGLRQAVGRLFWMAPDELLLLCADGAAEAMRLSEALEGWHATVADVSGMRVVFGLKGVGARDVLAKLCPVDFATVPVGGVRRTRAAQIAALLWRQNEDDWRIFTLRSVADYAWTLIATANRAGGEVGLYR